MYESISSLKIKDVLAILFGDDKDTGLNAISYRPGHHGTEAHVDCAGCGRGRSSMMDAACRKCVISGIMGKGDIGRVFLERDFVREYGDDSLAILLDMASFCEDLRLRASSFTTTGCGACHARRRDGIRIQMDRTLEDTAGAFTAIASMISSARPGKNEPKCDECVKDYRSYLEKMLDIFEMHDADMWSYDRIVPFVMPRFSSSRILPRPPEGSVFLRSYDVEAGCQLPPLHVAIYELPDSIEKLYFIVPWEYAMDEEELSLIVEARGILLRRRPEGTGFMDAASARSFFIGQSKDAIINAAGRRGIDLDAVRAQRLTSALVKYTSGLGVLEDVLMDTHIQDAYVNSPAGLNALHVVVDGEECSSNVYLSGSDVDAMISRLRAISGRPFSEASPVLDMDLGEFNTRVSVIGHPLAKGLAYAFRRHKKTPWTLPQLIGRGMLSAYSAALLSFLVDGQSSVLVTGTRGSGKTSLLGALMLEVPCSYRMLVIEDTPELPLEEMQRHGWKAQGLGTRASVSGSEAEFEASDALRAALRLGESALIMGEVRGPEARALYEAMRVGASGNSVMGTIHGASSKDVYERVVHDIGVEPASFKATDAVAVCSMVRPGGGAIRERRLMQVSEVVKGERDDDADSLFNDLIMYDAGSDLLKATHYIDTGRSEAMLGVAKKWGISLAEARDDVSAREMMLQAVVNAGKADPAVMEISAYSKCLGAFRMFREHDRKAHGRADMGQVYARWERWFGQKFLKGDTDVAAGYLRPGR